MRCTFPNQPVVRGHWLWCSVAIPKFRGSAGISKHIATEVLETLYPGATGLCWSGMYIIKVWLKRLTTSSQPGDRSFLGGVCMHYNIDH